MKNLAGAGLSILLVSSPLIADEALAPEEDQRAATEVAPVPEPPVLPPQIQSGEALEPEVTIRKGGKETIEEYRIRGRLYMVKIIPAAGPAYYMLDSDGDGELDVREENPTNVSVPQWILFSWD